MKQNGISGSNNASMTSDLLNDMLQQHPAVRVKQEVPHQLSQAMAVAEDMDDNSPIAGDPMLSSSSPGVHLQHCESMDDSDMLVWAFAIPRMEADTHSGSSFKPEVLKVETLKVET